MPVSSAAVVVVCLQWALVLAGGVLFWRTILSPAARARREPGRLAPWDTPFVDVLLFIWLVVMAGFLTPFVGQAIASALGLGKDAKMVILTVCYQGGMLLGVWLHRKFFAIRTAGPASHSEGSNRSPASQPSPLPLSRALAVGATTLLTWMPVVILTSQAGVELTRRAGLPVESQEVLTFFRDNRSPVMLAAMLFSAVVIAPINEELIFRATLFRYTRTRLPRWAGLALPAFLFSALHGSIPNYIPLAVLGIAFSLAYERTGRIESAIFAHALFNGYNVACLFIAPELVR